MFKNAGKRLGYVIKFITVFFMVIAGIAGIACIVGGRGIESLIILLVVLVLEFFLWVGSLFIIGMCDMMTDIHTIRMHLTAGETAENYDKLLELRNAGLITEEDFNKKVKRM